jgi:hypothetical protein
MGLTTAVYIQYITCGFSPQVFPNVPMHVQKALLVLLINLSICVFHVGPLPKIIPSYLNLLGSWTVLLN